MFRGVATSQNRFDNFKSKIRVYSGTGAAPDYTTPVVQQKLNQMYRKMQKAFGIEAERPRSGQPALSPERP